MEDGGFERPPHTRCEYYCCPDTHTHKTMRPFVRHFGEVAQQSRRKSSITKTRGDGEQAAFVILRARLASDVTSKLTLRQVPPRDERRWISILLNIVRMT